MTADADLLRKAPLKDLTGDPYASATYSQPCR